MVRKRAGGSTKHGWATSVPTPVALIALVICAFALGRGVGVALTLLVLILMGLCVVVLRSRSSRLEHRLDAMYEAASTDPLTGLANRRALLSLARHELARHQRLDGRLVVLMLDLDGFKQFNDRYGHAAGDAALCDVADALAGALRAQDVSARFGGDEFCVVAPETEDPRALANRVRHAIATAPTQFGPLRASVGLAVYPEDASSAEKLLRIADERLIAAKDRLHGRTPAAAPERPMRIAA